MGEPLLVVSGLSIHTFLYESIVGFRVIADFSHAIYSLVMEMWWGLLLGLVAVGVMHQVPKSIIVKILGQGGTCRGIVRAILGGLFLDLCNHGILMVGIKLRERGASLGQVFAFLIASPWNSFSLTLILISLIGLGYTLTFILLSALIAFATGVIVDKWVFPDKVEQIDETSSWADAWSEMKAELPSKRHLPALIIKDGWSEGQIIIKWIFFGIVLAAALRALVSPEWLQEWFGPTIIGVFLTLLGATIIEVCSEGSLPIGADLVDQCKSSREWLYFYDGWRCNGLH